MKKLILIRHGKSSWDTPVKDEDRPLTPRGVKDALKMAEHITDFLPNRFVIWTSPAKRALNTAVIFSQFHNIPQELVIVHEELYTFDESQLVSSIQSVKNEHNNLILFGHNGAVTDFVNKFGDQSIVNVPTSGAVIIEFPQEQWQSIANGKIIKTLFPKELQQ